MCTHQKIAASPVAKEKKSEVLENEQIENERNYFDGGTFFNRHLRDVSEGAMP